MNLLENIIAEKKIIVLDGGLASELEARGEILKDDLWSARVLTKNPKAIFDVHLDYYRHGADVATTATYQASMEGFLKRGFSEEEGFDFFHQAMTLANEARIDAQEDSNGLLIAASIGSYGAYLADGSEYRGNYDVTEQDLYNFHERRFKIFADLSQERLFDVVALETMPSFLELQILADLMTKYNLPGWMSCSLKDSQHISDGTKVSSVAELAEITKNIWAVGVNCTSAEKISGALKELALCSKPKVVYPNSGEIYDSKSKTWSPSGSPDGSDWLQHLPEWYDLGARLIGGCCRTKPTDIEAVAAWRESI